MNYTAIDGAYQYCYFKIGSEHYDRNEMNIGLDFRFHSNEIFFEKDNRITNSDVIYQRKIYDFAPNKSYPYAQVELEFTFAAKYQKGTYFQRIGYQCSTSLIVC